MATQKIKFPPAFKGLKDPYRYKVFYGGRGSGKSWTVARHLLLRALKEPITILCAREIQNSISDSVHRLLREQIDFLGWSQYFKVTQNAIYGIESGAEFMFKGLRFNSREIKSTEGVNVAWIEEAQAVSADSWDILIPTIREPNSEIWITFNPLDESDPTYQRFVLNPPDNAYIRKVNYDENPYFPEVLRQEMEWLKSRDYQSYLHVWEGEVRKHSNALIFGGYFKVEDFETPRDARFYHGCDWGFACLVGETVIPTNKGYKLLKDIEIGDMVLTREGYKRVLDKQSRGIRKVHDVDCGYGIICTEDHRIYTAEGWKEIKDLERTETLCTMKSSLMARFIRGILTANTQTIFTANGSQQENITSEYFTEIYGNTIMGKSLKGATYTTLMVIHLIMTLATLCALLKATIRKYITTINWGAFPRIKCESIGKYTAILKRIGKNAEKNHLQRHKKDGAFVWNVASLLKLPMFIKNFVLQGAENIKIQGIAKKSMYANVVEKYLLLLLTKLEKPVLQSVPISSQFLGEREVFDITVENGEYFANGVLVHNCDPTTLLRCFIKDKTLYIDREAWAIGCEIDNTPALFDQIETARKWPIKADCARPETISYMRRQGFNISPAKKWQGSVEDGIEFLKTFEIVIHPRCKHMIDEMNHYSYKVDKQTGDILPIIVDAWNHLEDSLRYALDGLIKGRGSMNISKDALFRNRRR